jgi:acyl dehydratase
MSELERVVGQYRHLIGAEYTYTAPEEIGAAFIRQFALAIGDLNPLYVDHTAAAQGPYGGIVAPPTLVCETTQYYRGEVDDEGGFSDRPQMPPGQPIRAGNEYIFHRPLRPDDIITARWRISDIYGKHGQSGSLLFVQCHITYSNQDGEPLAENIETLPYRLDASK